MAEPPGGAPEPEGVLFPVTDGGRSTAALGRAVVADALRPVDPSGAQAAERERDWRRGYLQHFRRLVVAGLGSPQDARRIAEEGLASLSARMVLCSGDDEVPLREALGAGARVRPAGRTAPFQAATVRGTGAPERELALPYRGSLLRGADLARQMDRWVERGVVEASCAQAVAEVAGDPDGLSLPGSHVVVLGAGAEMGPLAPLLRWGATVVAVDLPRPALWKRLLDGARRSAGTVHLPSRARTPDADPAESGADLLRDLPALADWLDEAAWAGAAASRLVMGTYAYADGATHLQVEAAADALVEHVRRSRPDTAVAVLATPTDVFAVPDGAVEQSRGAYASRAALGRPLARLSSGRLLAPNYPDGAQHALADGLVPQQGPNYALAKRAQRWRATVARAQGAAVSLAVAPPTRTRSVTRNRALAAAYAGAHRFGVEVFEPATSNTLMAALLVHDLRSGGAAHEHPWQDEAHRAAHGGLWRTAYAPRSALGLAAVLGLPALGLSSLGLSPRGRARGPAGPREQ